MKRAWLKITFILIALSPVMVLFQNCKDDSVIKVIDDQTARKSGSEADIANSDGDSKSPLPAAKEPVKNQNEPKNPNQEVIVISNPESSQFPNDPPTIATVVVEVRPEVNEVKSEVEISKPPIAQEAINIVKNIPKDKTPVKKDFNLQINKDEILVQTSTDSHSSPTQVSENGSQTSTASNSKPVETTGSETKTSAGGLAANPSSSEGNSSSTNTTSTSSDTSSSTTPVATDDGSSNSTPPAGDTQSSAEAHSGGGQTGNSTVVENSGGNSATVSGGSADHGTSSSNENSSDTTTSTTTDTNTGSDIGSGSGSGSGSAVEDASDEAADDEDAAVEDADPSDTTSNDFPTDSTDGKICKDALAFVKVKQIKFGIELNKYNLLKTFEGFVPFVVSDEFAFNSLAPAKSGEFKADEKQHKKHKVHEIQNIQRNIVIVNPSGKKLPTIKLKRVFGEVLLCGVNARIYRSLAKIKIVNGNLKHGHRLGAQLEVLNGNIKHLKHVAGRISVTNGSIQKAEDLFMANVSVKHGNIGKLTGLGSASICDGAYTSLKDITHSSTGYLKLKHLLGYVKVSPTCK